MNDDDYLNVTDAIRIPLAEIEISAVRAQGPGGQHGDKASTAVRLRFDARTSESLDADSRDRILDSRDRRVSASGIITIKAQRFRSQAKNRQDALDRLTDLLRRSTIEAKPRKRTRPSKAARKKRVDDKTKRGRIKALRRTTIE